VPALPVAAAALAAPPVLATDSPLPTLPDALAAAVVTTVVPTGTPQPAPTLAARAVSAERGAHSGGMSALTPSAVDVETTLVATTPPDSPERFA